MHKLWFLNLNWPWWVFVLMLIVAIAVPYALTRSKIITCLGAALVLYLGVLWLMWWWVPVVFWLAFAVATALAVEFYVQYTRRYSWYTVNRHKKVAIGLSWFVLSIPLAMLFFSFVGYLAPPAPHFHSSLVSCLFWLTVMCVVAAAVLLIASARGAKGKLLAGAVVAVLFATLFFGLLLLNLHDDNSHKGPSVAGGTHSLPTPQPSSSSMSPPPASSSSTSEAPSPSPSNPPTPKPSPSSSPQPSGTHHGGGGQSNNGGNQPGGGSSSTTVVEIRHHNPGPTHSSSTSTPAPKPTPTPTPKPVPPVVSVTRLNSIEAGAYSDGFCLNARLTHSGTITLSSSFNGAFDKASATISAGTIHECDRFTAPPSPGTVTITVVVRDNVTHLRAVSTQTIKVTKPAHHPG